jgi:hypothetical protein
MMSHHRVDQAFAIGLSSLFRLLTDCSQFCPTAMTSQCILEVLPLDIMELVIQEVCDIVVLM